MSIYKPLLILAIIAGASFSCQPTVKERLCQSWQMNGFDVNPAYEKKLIEESNKTNQLLFREFMRSFMKEMTIKFYPNGDFAQISKDRYSTGRYTYDENSGLLTLENTEGKVVFHVEPEADDNLHLFVSNNKDVGNNDVSMSWV